MPGTEIFANKLLLFLGGLVVYIILLAISIVRLRKIYWDTAKLSKRQKRKQEAERAGIVLIFVCVAVGAMVILLALTVDLIVATIFAVASAFMILLGSSASGRAGGQRSSGGADGGFPIYDPSDSGGGSSDGDGGSGDGE